MPVVVADGGRFITKTAGSERATDPRKHHEAARRADQGLHLIGAVPVAFTDGAMSETWVGGAAGLGLRAHVTPSIALHLESYAAFATKGHGVTFPAFVGGEVWF